VSAKKEPDEDFSFIQKYLDTDRSKYLIKDEEHTQKASKRNLKNDYVLERSIEKGNVVHYYLSFIKYNTETERRFARLKTISDYGGLLPATELEKLFDKADLFVAKNGQLFSASKWSRVFTEHSIFASQGKELRLDRLMIDDKNKEILIIDYKTGELYEPQQMENYIAAVAALNVVQREQFRVMGKFVAIDLLLSD
jgi:hypothetical protein